MKNFGFFLVMISVLAMGIPSAYAEGESWIKDENGCAVFNPDPQPNESITWNGKCKNGYAEGAGTVTWFVDGKPGTTFTGTRTRGKMNGQASVVFANGDRFDGSYANDKCHGKGVYTTFDRWRYEGVFDDDDDGCSSQDGTFTAPTGKISKGSFDDFLLSVNLFRAYYK
ncbi:MAG: hypothetical protein LBE24_00755 [Methylobacillus sp.]|jgi:hypothetical protein|nr:hypothetical protein [Methylobacillus sp.]